MFPRVLFTTFRTAIRYHERDLLPVLVFDQVTPRRFEARRSPATRPRVVKAERLRQQCCARDRFAVICGDATGVFYLYIHHAGRMERRAVLFEDFDSAHHAANVVASLSSWSFRLLRRDVAEDMAERFGDTFTPTVCRRVARRMPAAAIARYAIRAGLT